MPTRDDAWKLLCEYTQSESLRKHMLAVEACVRAYARKNGADENLWGLAALLHDFDYERWPNHDHAADREHPAAGAKILGEHGYSEELIRAILSHAEYSGVPRQTPLEHTLFACDELAGFLTACTRRCNQRRPRTRSPPGRAYCILHRRTARPGRRSRPAWYPVDVPASRHEVRITLAVPDPHRNPLNTRLAQ